MIVGGWGRLWCEEAPGRACFGMESETQLMNILSKSFLAPALTLGLTGLIAIEVVGMADDRADTYTWFEPIQDIRKLVADDFVDGVDEAKMKALQQGAIEGMLKVLDDPYTEFIPTQSLRDFEKTMQGSYVGIGAEVRVVNGWLTIMSPMAGSPAIEAGIRAGDQIRAIDGTTTQDEPINDSINRLMGEEGTDVKVSVHRADTPEDQVEELTITRRHINVRTVEGVHRQGTGYDYFIDPGRKIGYVRLTQFTATTPRDLVQAAAEMLDNGLNGLVLDLRFNPGGSLGAAIAVSDLFLAKGRILSFKGPSVPEQTIEANAPGTLPEFPMIVLVNGESASASEIVSGALKDNGRAKVLGTRTFGKGKVQDVKELPSGVGNLKITTAYYYLPSGRLLQRRPDSAEWGVDPDPGFFLSMTTSEYRQMIQIQQELDVIKSGNDEGDWANPAWIQERLKDPQLSAALQALQGRVDTGEWKAPAGDMPANDEASKELSALELRRDFLTDQLEEMEKQIEGLRSFLPAESAEPPADLIPNDALLKGGTVEVRDASGKVVSVLRIDEDDNLELALYNAKLKPVKEEEKKSEPVASETKSDK